MHTLTTITIILKLSRSGGGAGRWYERCGGWNKDTTSSCDLQNNWEWTELKLVREFCLGFVLDFLLLVQFCSRFCFSDFVFFWQYLWVILVLCIFVCCSLFCEFLDFLHFRGFLVLVGFLDFLHFREILVLVSFLFFFPTIFFPFCRFGGQWVCGQTRRAKTLHFAHTQTSDLPQLTHNTTLPLPTQQLPTYSSPHSPLAPSTPQSHPQHSVKKKTFVQLCSPNIPLRVHWHGLRQAADTDSECGSPTLALYQ